uniref:Uncharacterized protein n=1 Tax=Hordeum vulgare subsp. vulgare TaxID=112509 RepID=A0A8I6YA72_HORVV
MANEHQTCVLSVPLCLWVFCQSNFLLCICMHIYSLVSCCSAASGFSRSTAQAYFNIDLLLLNSGCSKTIVSFNATASHDQI